MGKSRFCNCAPHIWRPCSLLKTRQIVARRLSCFRKSRNWPICRRGLTLMRQLLKLRHCKTMKTTPKRAKKILNQTVWIISRLICRMRYFWLTAYVWLIWRHWRLRPKPLLMCYVRRMGAACGLMRLLCWLTAWQMCLLDPLKLLKLFNRLRQVVKPLIHKQGRLAVSMQIRRKSTR